MATKKEDTLAVIEKEVSPIVSEAQALTISNDKSMTNGAELLSRLNLRLDKIIAEKEKVTKPLDEALKAERSRWKPFETQLDEAIALIRRKMSVYQTEQKRAADEEEARIAARVGEGKGHLKPETAIKQMEEVERPTSAVTAASGMVKFKTVQDCEVQDFIALIQATGLEYVDVSMKKLKILAAKKEGIELSGVRYWTEERPDNYR